MLNQRMYLWQDQKPCALPDKVAQTGDKVSSAEDLTSCPEDDDELAA